MLLCECSYMTTFIKDAILNFFISKGDVVLSLVSKWWQQVQLAEWLIVFKFYCLFYFFYMIIIIIFIILFALLLLLWVKVRVKWKLEHANAVHEKTREKPTHKMFIWYMITIWITFAKEKILYLKFLTEKA